MMFKIWCHQSIWKRGRGKGSDKRRDWKGRSRSKVKDSECQIEENKLHFYGVPFWHQVFMYYISYISQTSFMDITNSLPLKKYIKNKEEQMRPRKAKLIILV